MRRSLGIFVPPAPPPPPSSNSDKNDRDNGKRQQMSPHADGLVNGSDKGRGGVVDDGRGTRGGEEGGGGSVGGFNESANITGGIVGNKQRNVTSRVSQAGDDYDDEMLLGDLGLFGGEGDGDRDNFDLLVLSGDNGGGGDFTGVRSNVKESAIGKEQEGEEGNLQHSEEDAAKEEEESAKPTVGAATAAAAAEVRGTSGCGVGIDGCGLKANPSGTQSESIARKVKYRRSSSPYLRAAFEKQRQQQQRNDRAVSAGDDDDSDSDDQRSVSSCELDLDLDLDLVGYADGADEADTELAEESFAESDFLATMAGINSHSGGGRVRSSSFSVSSWAISPLSPACSINSDSSSSNNPHRPPPSSARARRSLSSSSVVQGPITDDDLNAMLGLNTPTKTPQQQQLQQQHDGGGGSRHKPTRVDPPPSPRIRTTTRRAATAASAAADPFSHYYSSSFILPTPSTLSAPLPLPPQRCPSWPRSSSSRAVSPSAVVAPTRSDDRFQDDGGDSSANKDTSITSNGTCNGARRSNSLPVSFSTVTATTGGATGASAGVTGPAATAHGIGLGGHSGEVQGNVKNLPPTPRHDSSSGFDRAMSSFAELDPQSQKRSTAELHMDDKLTYLARALAAEAQIAALEDVISGRPNPEALSGVQSAEDQNLEHLSSETVKTHTLKGSTGTHALLSGDLVCLRHEAVEPRSMIIGDINQRSAEVQLATSISFGDGIFRMCPRFSYRAKIEVSKIRKAISQAEDQIQVSEKELNLDLAIRWSISEKEHNADLLQSLSKSTHSTADGAALDVEKERIKYGDVVQLQHFSSGFFLAMHKTPARLNPTCRRTSLKDGSLAAHFKLLPRFKVCSMGSAVFDGDDVLFQSMKQEGFYLGVAEVPPATNIALSGTTSESNVSKNHSLLHTIPGLRTPMLLRPLAGLEVNGSIEVRSLTLQLCGRPVAGTLKTGIHLCRLLHPETNAFMQASADPDKGGAGGLSAHVPYIKLLPPGTDPFDQSHVSGKACWAFESLDRTKCSPVQWCSMQLRLRHVASGKYLSVNAESVTSNDDSGDVRMFDTVLVGDDSRFGTSDPSTIFYLLPIHGDSCGACGANLSGGITTARLEHRDVNGSILYFAVLSEPKLPLQEKPVNSNEDGSRFGSNSFRMNHYRLDGTRRIVFSTNRSDLGIIKIASLPPDFIVLLSKLLAYKAKTERYSHAYHEAALDPACNKTSPISVLGECDSLIRHCFNLIRAFRKGDQNKTCEVAESNFMAAVMKETSNNEPAALAHFFVGEHDPRIQKLAVEVKLMDALFNAIVAPYNWRSKTEWNPRNPRARLNRDPFKSTPVDGKPLLLHRLFHIAVQKALESNIGAQTYFARRATRCWEYDHHETRCFVLWRNFAIDKMNEDHGMSNILGNLIQSSDKIVSMFVNDTFVDRFKELLQDMGPDERLCLLLASMCSLKGRPSRIIQEAVTRKMWMKPKDRYSVGVSLHECSADATQNYGPILDLDGTTVEAASRAVHLDGVQTDKSEKVPSLFLGSEGGPTYAPVCVAWAGSDAWTGGCGRFWWSASSLGLPVAEKLEDLTVTVDYVPIEHVLWVLEPERLCKTVTGTHWENPHQKEVKNTSFLSSQEFDGLNQEGRNRFDRHKKLANFVVAQMSLWTEMCRGRSYCVIRWLEKAFSYKMLLNILTNPRLPYTFRSASLALCMALWVDRFPQMAKCKPGALPEKLWVYKDHEFEQAKLDNGGKAGSDALHKDAELAARSLRSLNRHDQVPVVRPLTLGAGISAFPHFDPSPKLSASASAFAGNLGNHEKFFLLQQCCNKVMSSFGPAGRLEQNARDQANTLATVAASAQRSLLELGFSSSYDKLKKLAVASGKLLDGRSDLMDTGKVFSSPKDRYKIQGDRSAVMIRLKIELISIFRIIAHLRTNYRLSQLLANFRAEEVTSYDRGCATSSIHPHSDSSHSSITNNEPQILSDAKPLRCGELSIDEAKKMFEKKEIEAEKMLKKKEMLYDDFELLFPGGAVEKKKDDAAKLDLCVLSDKPDLDQALVDCLIYEDDNLMSAALHLLESTYGQRRALLYAMRAATLLPTPTLPVYGNVNALRLELTELMFLARTYTTWGVKSLISGPFGDTQFRDIMLICDRLLTFLHTPEGANKLDSAGHHLSARSVSKVFDAEEKWVPLDPVDPKLFQGSFAGTTNLWSHDVATTWAERLWTGVGPQREQEAACNRNSHHQDVLRVCDVQALAMEATVLDQHIAFKGSVCTVEERNESQRRLTMVKKAMLCVCVGFTAGNRANQALMFDTIPQLQAQSRSPQSSAPSEVGWPSTVHDLAQLSIITILRNNAILCERVPKHLATLFTLLVEQSPDPSTSPALELLSILVKPEGAALYNFQRHVCNLLLVEGTAGEKMVKLPTAVKNCVSEASRAGGCGTLDNYSPLDGAAETIKDPPFPQADGNEVVIRDPARLLLLLSSLLEGGNERCAGILNRQAGITIDAVCIAFLQATGTSVDPPTAKSLSNWETLRRMSTMRHLLRSEELLDLLVEEGSACKSLLELLVELVFVLPLNTDQVFSMPLWFFLEHGATAFEALGELKQFSDSQQNLCVNLADMTERLLSTVVRLKQWGKVLASHTKCQVVQRLCLGAAAILAKRNFNTDTLMLVFEQECNELEVEALDKSQFLHLVMRLMAQRAEVFEEDVGEEEFERESQVLEKEFEEADKNGNGLIDSGEFATLYGKHVASGRKGDELFSTVSTTVLQKSGHDINQRTAACLRRIIRASETKGANVGVLQFTRVDHHQSIKRINKRMSSREGRFPEQNNSGVTANQPSNEAESSDPNKQLQKRFDVYRRDIEDNKWIQDAIMRRRFDMVSILEQGTPAPKHRSIFSSPPARGMISTSPGGGLVKRFFSGISNRNQVALETPTSPTGLKTFGTGSKLSNEVFLARKESEHVLRHISHKTLSWKNRASSQKNVNDVSTEVSSRRIELSPLNSLQVVSGSGSTPIVTHDELKEVSASKIQAIVRGQRERRNFVVKLQYARANPNTLSGAVELDWNDLVRRFVSYAHANYDAEARSKGRDGSGGAGENGGGVLSTAGISGVSNGTNIVGSKGEEEIEEWNQINISRDSETCTPSGTVELIFDTWRAHLLKARTRIEDLGVAEQLHELDLFELTEAERTVYIANQNTLNDLGVTALLTTVVASLSGNHCRLMNSATLLFNELLNGGNATVQNSLLQHLERHDEQGRLLQYADTRIVHAFEGLCEARKSGNLGSNNETRAAYAAKECELAQSTARFLQLLCEGHHSGFQNYLRECKGANAQVNLVKRLADLLVFLCDSTFVVSRFTHIELELVSQVLDTLVEMTQGPCVGNQAALVMQSDVIVALNLIINSENARDEALAKKDPGHVDMRGKSYQLLAACLESSRTGGALHKELGHRLDTSTLEFSKLRLESTIHRLLALQYGESRVATEDKVRIPVLQQRLVTVTTVLTKLDNTRTMFGHLLAGVGSENTSKAELAMAALEKELKQAMEMGKRKKQEEKERKRLEAKKVKNEDPQKMKKLKWFRTRFPVLAFVGGVLNNPKITPFWIFLLVIDCLFLLLWSSWRTGGKYDRIVSSGHLVVSVTFALDVCLRFTVHGLTHVRLLSFWSDRFNIMDAALVFLDVAMYLLDTVFFVDGARGFGALKTLRGARVVRMFRSVRGMRTLRVAKVARFARLWRYLHIMYKRIICELDSKARKLDAEEPLVGFVEIAWHGSIERTCFPLPFEIKYLSAETKQGFLSKVDLSTSEKRMQALLKASDFFIAEMGVIYKQAEMSRSYRVLHSRLYTMRAAVYVLVVAINLNQLFMPARWGVMAPFEALRQSTQQNVDESSEAVQSSFAMTSVLSLVSFIGYGAIIYNSAVTEVPMVIRAIDTSGVKDEKTTKSVWEVWWPTLALTSGLILFVIVHALNFRPSFELYTLLNVCAAFVGFAAFRQHVTLFVLSKNQPVAEDGHPGEVTPSVSSGSVPSSSSSISSQLMNANQIKSLVDEADKVKRTVARAYAIAYDCLFGRQFLRNHALLACCVSLGYFVNTQFYTLMLLDVVNLTPFFSNLTQAILAKGNSFGLIFYLFCATVIIYASFGMNSSFRKDLTIPSENDEEDKECGALGMLACFYYVFYYGTFSGELSEVLSTPEPGSHDYVMRIIYDTVFFLWVGLVLMNIITGLIVDIFFSTSTEILERARQMDTDCFVCGMSRPAYEESTFGLGAASFNKHMENDHFIWSYVYYIAYLTNKKDHTEDSGIESYVRSQYSTSSLEWIPNRTSFSLEAFGKTGGAGAGGQVQGKFSETRPDLREEPRIPNPALT